MSTSKEQQIYDQIRREHEQLRELLGNVHQAVNKRAEAATEIDEMMSSLQEHVRVHFQEEEEGGFFNEVVSQAPRMSDRAEALKNEHGDLTAAVAELAYIAKQANDLYESLQTKFHAFSKTLMHHESKENELLLDTYQEDIGSTD